MKRNKIIIGSAGIIAIAAILAVSPWSFNGNQGSYEQKDLSSLKAKSAEDAKKWIEARYIDQETGLPITPEKLALIEMQLRKSPRNKSITFIEQGPDNIGGRTRAINVDRTNNNRVWAGGVSGGLFVTTNRGHQWSRVDSYIDAGASPFISSMTQTPDGTLYVATGFNGEFQEPFGAGNGVWYSTDFGTTWSTIPGTSTCVEVVSSNADNFVWMATTSGVSKWKLGDAAVTPVSIATGTCRALSISKDGTVVMASIGSNVVYVSNDSGSTWSNKSGTVANNLVPQGAGRIEYAISPTKNSSNKYSLYAVRTSGNLQGMHVSHDNGQTWHQFVGASGTPSNLDIYRDQGRYNTVVSVTPNNPEKILIGGIDIWQWQQTVNNPPSGGFEKLSEWFLPMFSPKYVHADNHEMKWDALNRLYVGNDGGIGITDDYGQTWYPANRGYNVTQFYGIAFDRDGAVMGGTQDNGTLYNDHTLSTFQEFREVNGGDGFACEISFWNPRVMFSSIYYNAIYRSGDKGQTWSSFSPSFPGTYTPVGTGGGDHPFNTSFVLAEYYDLNSEDSVIFIPTKNYAAGTSIQIPSLSTGDSMTYVTPVALYFTDTLNHNPSLTQTGYSVVNAINGQNVLLSNYSYTPFPTASGTSPPTIGDSLLVEFPSGDDTVVVQSVGTYNLYFGQNPATGEIYPMGNEEVVYNIPWDTLTIQDPYQSWFVVYTSKNGGELWGTRNALRLSVQSPQWVVIARGIGAYNNVDIEFTRNLNHMFVSTGSGGVWRIDGLGSIYTSDPDFAQKAGYFGIPTAVPPTHTTATQITTTNYQGIAVNPNNPDDLVLFAGFSGINRRSNNATAGSPSFTNLPAISSPQVACYDGIIDRDDPEIIVAGTANGVWVTENGGATWTNASAGFEGTPVYKVRQSWRTWDEGNRRPGEIYIGTFGRGIWSSASYLGIGNNGSNGSNTASSVFKTKLKTFPNPTTDNTTITFELAESTTVNVNVYSISGVLVKTITKKNMSAGSQSIQIDGNDLPNGTYIVKFNAGKQNETAKFIKM